MPSSTGSVQSERHPEYIRQNRVDKDEFFQTWGMMSGLWNTVDFERIWKIVRIQRSCPEIVKVAARWGVWQTTKDVSKSALLRETSTKWSTPPNA